REVWLGSGKIAVGESRTETESGCIQNVWNRIEQAFLRATRRRGRSYRLRNWYQNLTIAFDQGMLEY
ncbi:MAG: hypothetical protein M1482_15640, partial [Chloroflexi bacterium]|nr:hypothetical protein [Chloroflexota bacterium]